MKSIDVLIIIENKNRELESALLLKKILKGQGVSCELCQQGWSISAARFKYSPKVIVTPWCYDSKDLALMRSFRSSRKDGKVAIVNLHCEQLVFRDALDFYIPKGSVAGVYHCAWGPYYERILKEAGVSDELVCVTGSPRLDFFRREFASDSRSDLSSRFRLDINKKWVLFVGNFSSAFMDDATIDTLRSRGIDGGEGRRARALAAYEAMLSWMEETASTDDLQGDIEFIYRPHPSEPITESLLDIERRHSNITVIKELSIREWYQACDIAFTWCSTSSVEAVCAGIPIFAIEPFEMPESDVIDIVQGLDKVHSSFEMKVSIRNVLDGVNIVTNGHFVEDIKRYYRIDGDLASERTAALVMKALHTGEHSFESHITYRYALWMLVKYAAKLMLLKAGLLYHVPKFKVWIDNKVTAGDFENARRVVDRLSYYRSTDGQR